MRPRMMFTSLLALCTAALLVAPACARQILVVDLSQADAPTRMLVASIQGVVNRDPSEVGIFTIRGPVDARWLSLYEGEIVEVAPDELASKVSDRLAGQVLYDPAEEHAVNLAAAAAAILDAALTPQDMGLKTVLDARGRWPNRAAAYRYAIAQVLPEAATDRIAVIGPERSDLRDYLAKERVLAVDLDRSEQEQAGIFREILARLKPGALLVGAPGMAVDEGLVGLLAQRQHILVPISYASNLSFHSAHPISAPLHQLDLLAPLAYQTLVTFVYEGGTDLGNALADMRALWDDPARGSVPVGWTVSPALLDLAPAVIQSYIADAWLSGNDELILAPNGPGYLMPSGQGEWGAIVERMAPWVRAGDLRVAALSDPGPAADVERALSQYGKSGVRGILLGPGTRLQSGLYANVPVVAQAIRARDAFDTLQAIRDAGKTNKYIYVSVDPTALTPTDIAHIASRLGERYAVLRPREFLEVARQTTVTSGAKPKKGSAVIGDVSLRPAAPEPEDDVEVRVTVRSPVKLDSVRAVYSVSGGPAEWTAVLHPGPDHTYSGSIPPLLEGGEASVRVRATDAENGVTWTQPVRFEVDAPDGDDDGLTDAVERLLRADSGNPDTDADGWRDGNDEHPLATDVAAASYLWPLVPVGDAPYIVEGGGSVTEGIRAVTGDERAMYELPLSGAPRGARAMLEAVVGGEYRIEVSSDGKEWQDIGTKSSEVPLAPGSWEIPAHYLAARTLRVRLSDATPEGGAPAQLAALGIVAHPDGPSVLGVGTDPAYPVVGLPVRVLASVFDPDGVAAVRLHYSINEGGTIAVPMAERGTSQVYAGEIHGTRDGDNVTYWVSAADAKKNASASRRFGFHVGTVAKEAISLRAGRDFEGQWEVGSEWGGSRWSPRKDAVDAATINIMGGAYRVWLLAAPRGGGIRVSLDGKAAGVAEASARDGWQSLGTVDLARGRHAVTLTSTDEVRCGYTQLMITQDRREMPPEGTVRDLYNSLTVIAPLPGETVKGLVDIEATGTGNIAVVECAVDGTSIGREKNAPYRFRWNARRAAAGTYSIEVRALDAAGDILLTTALEVDLSK